MANAAIMSMTLQAEPFCTDISDDRLHALIDDLISWDRQRAAAAQLHRQPGAYRCSIREIDALVDIACRTPGVLGAQIAGAGLGGCAMVLAESEAVSPLTHRLNRLFYERLGLPSGVTVCTPISRQQSAANCRGRPPARLLKSEVRGSP